MNKCFSKFNGSILACTQLITDGQIKDRQLAATYVQRGYLQREIKPLAAISDYDDALKIEANLPDALNGRAWVRMTLREYDRALEDLDKSIALSPTASSGVAYFYRGYTYLRKLDYVLALADLNEAQKYQPNNLEVYAARGEAERALESYEPALRDFDEISQRAPKDTRGLVGRSTVLELTGHVPDALAAMEKALTLDPGDENIRAERDRLRELASGEPGPK